MSDQLMSDQLTPILVSLRKARRLLDDMSHRKFWQLAAQGEFEVVGEKRHRKVLLRSIADYVDRLPRAPYSRPKPSELTAA